MSFHLNFHFSSQKAEPVAPPTLLARVKLWQSQAIKTLQRWDFRLFHEREVIFRQSGKLRYFHLSPRVQRLLAGSVLAAFSFFVVWGGSFTWGFFSGQRQLAEHEKMVAVAQENYRNLIEVLAGTRPASNSRADEREANAASDDHRQLRDGLANLSKSLDGLLVDLAKQSPDDKQQQAKLQQVRNDLEMQINALTIRIDQEKQARLGTAKALESLVSLTMSSQGADMTRPETAMMMANKQIDQLRSLYQFQTDMTKKFATYVNEDTKNRSTVLAKLKLPTKQLLTLVGYRADQTDSEALLPSVVGLASDLLGTQISIEKQLVKLKAMDNLMRCLPLSLPLDTIEKSSGYGRRNDPLADEVEFHKGLDLRADSGTPIYSAAGGRVINAGRAGDYGQMVQIDHGCGVMTRYGHMRTISVREGQVIGPHTIIGGVGNTGRSSGYHLHFEVLINGKNYDPDPFIEASRHVRQTIPSSGIFATSDIFDSKFDQARDIRG